jgi:hypothetical protein
MPDGDQSSRTGAPTCLPSSRSVRMRRVASSQTRASVLLLLGASLLLIAGCTRPTPPEVGSEQHVGTDTGPKVTLTAYINVSSGCQQPTVNFIKQLGESYKGDVGVQLIDFGDAGEGTKAWKASGHNCMALEINGSSTVTWGSDEEQRTVTFQYPVGFTWTHEDLEAAIAAARQGELRPGDAEEAQTVGLLQAKVLGQSIRIGDRETETGQLLINDAVVVEVTRDRGDLTPAHRVTAAANGLTEALQKPFKPSSLSVGQMEDGWAVMADDEPVLVATEADAEAADTDAQKLADQWAAAIREGLVKAASPSGPPETP